MSDPSPFYIARWIADEIRESNFISLQTAIENSIKDHIPQFSEEKVSDLVEKNEPEVFTSLGEISDQLRRNGTEPSFLLEGEPGTSYIKSQNIEFVTTLTRLKQLSPEEFEQFCAKLLSALGAASNTVGGSNDGGVDFTAFDLPVSIIEIAALHACCLTVIGQAKRYNDRLITVTDLRSFLGGAIVKSDDIKRSYIRYGIYSPTVYAFWTTSDFHQSARDYGISAGLWCLGGLSLAQLAFRIGIQKFFPII